MENPSKAPLSADDLMKVSWKMFQERFLKFLYVFLLAAVVFLFTMTILLALAMASGDGGIVFVAFFLTFVALVIIVLVQNIMFFEIVDDKNIRIRQAFRKALPKIKPYIGSLTLYFLITLNLIVLFAFLGVFVLMSTIFVSMLSALQSISVILGMLSAFLIFFMGIVLTVLFIFTYIWQCFLFFDVIIGGMPGREALDHSLSLIVKYRRSVFERVGIFFLCYILILLTLTMLSGMHPIFGTLTEMANYILGMLGVLFLYAMYENLKAIGPDKADTAPRQTVSLLLKSGAVIFLTITLLMIISCAFLLVQTDFPSVAAQALTGMQSSIWGL